MVNHNAPPIEVCMARMLSEDRAVVAARAAIDENSENAPRMDENKPQQSASRLALALLTKKCWQNGRALKVRFIGGRHRVRCRVIEHAHEWQDHANIRFSYVSDSARAHIRISFRRGLSWSYVGTDALQIGQNSPTMNYGWLTPGLDDRKFRRVVKHEFGHALGCVHEHQHPGVPIAWNKPVVYKYYGSLGWSRSEVDENVFKRYSVFQTNWGLPDRDSIMHYPVPDAHTLNDYSAPWNTTLSDRDKEFIGRIYPNP